VVIADHCITLRRQMLEWMLDKQVSTGVNVDAVRCLLMAMSVLVKEPPPAVIATKWRGYSRLAKEWSRARKAAAESGTLAEFMMAGTPTGAQTDGFEK
jgi:hypothetical protein